MAQPPSPGSRAPGAPRRRPRGGLIAVGLLVAIVGLASACADAADTPEPVSAPATTVPPIRAPAPLPDTRDVELAAVAGRRPPPFPISVRGGEADLVGTVTGPGGPVPGATVRLERFVGDRRASLTLRTDRQGRYRALNVYGGRYRIRAWRTPDLALTVPELRFVPGDGETAVDLTLTRHRGLTVQAVASSASPLVDGEITVTALVNRRRVDGEGIVTAPAAEGRSVRLTASLGWGLDGPATRTVDADGRATWTVVCTEAGPGELRVRAGDDEVRIVTACQDPPDEPEEPTGDPAPDPDFPIGERFSPPYGPALPAGRYEVVDGPGSCGVSFERYVDGAWEETRRTATGTSGFEVSTPFRAVEVIGSSPPCLYERVS